MDRYMRELPWFYNSLLSHPWAIRNRSFLFCFVFALCLPLQVNTQVLRKRAMGHPSIAKHNLGYPPRPSTQGLLGLATGQVITVCSPPNRDYLELWGSLPENTPLMFVTNLSGLKERKSIPSLEAKFWPSWIHLPFLNKQHTMQSFTLLQVLTGYTQERKLAGWEAC